MRHFVLRLSTFILTLCLSGLLGLSSLQAQDGDPANGESLYRTNCATCHKIARNLTGPALSKVYERYPAGEDRLWLYEWVRNSPGLIADGDERAVALFEQYNRVAMLPFPNLEDQDIEDILAYVKAEDEKEPEVAVTTTGGGADPLADPAFYYALFGLVAVLLIIALLLVIITATLVSAVRAKENKEPLAFADVSNRARGMLKNNFVMTTLVVVLLVGGALKYIEFARDISLNQGYMPEQPIAYSHKLHAGDYKIECEYCHSGVTKSKNAWIPSVNVCMNCHKTIQEGPTTGTEEIAKIYAAIGFDPEKGQYIEGYEQKPVKWERIHNLPDHAYFNHAQHVVLGGLECQECHGPIEEMEVVYQYSNLGMGWCVSCHREEKVKSLVKGKLQPNSLDLTVEDMGGLNCARCHY